MPMKIGKQRNKIIPENIGYHVNEFDWKTNAIDKRIYICCFLIKYSKTTNPGTK